MNTSIPDLEKIVDRAAALHETLKQAAEGAKAGGFDPVQSAPVLYLRYPATTAHEMASVLLEVWDDTKTYDVVIEALQKCLTRGGTPAYSWAGIIEGLQNLPGWYLVTENAPWPKNPYQSQAFSLKKGEWRLINFNMNETADNISVWSTNNGQDWSPVTVPVPWTTSGWNGTSYAVLDNKIWALCGPTHSVWYSSDGINWSRATDAPGWPKRNGHTSAAFNGKIWLMGGFSSFQSNRTNYNDVWYSSDGIKWECAASHAKWAPRFYSSSIAFNNRLWIIGGRNAQGTCLSEAWCMDENMQWQTTGSLPWEARGNACLEVFGNKLRLIGGDTGSKGTSDMWTMDVSNHWEHIPDYVPWATLSSMGSIYRDKMIWLAGGGAIGVIHPGPTQLGKCVWLYSPRS